MLKKTTGAFDGARTHDLHITGQLDVQPTGTRPLERIVLSTDIL